MPPVDKKAQEAEALARQEAGVDPNLNAGALDVVDDAPGGDPAPQPRAPAQDEPARPAPPVKSAYDTKRADIVSRFKVDRTTQADEARDDISDFARSGMPPEFEPPAPEPAADEPEVADAEPPAPQPQTVKVKVRGQEIEMSQEDLIAHAQKSLAGESYLDEGKTKLKEIDTLLRETREKATRAGQPAPHQGRQNGAQTEDQPATDPAADPNTTDDPLNRLVESLQFGGDQEETRTLLRNTIAEEAGKIVDVKMQKDRLRDEGARAQKVLADFLGQNADIAEDPMAKAAVEAKIYELQLEDMRALGIDPNQIPTAHGGPPTPGDIAQAHRWYRTEGIKVRTPKEMLETAVDSFRKWKGTAKPSETPADPAQRAAPRVELTVDRANRRQAIPQQPSRTAVPKPGGDQPAPQPRDRSSIVADMAKQRGAPRGKIVA